MRRLIILIALLLFCVAMFGCNKEYDSIQIAATTLPVYEFTAKLCQGTNINVTCLVTENVSCLHDYSLQVKQIQAIENADFVVVSGAGLEHFMDDILPFDKIIDASAGIELKCADHIHEHTDTGHTHEDDPHIWLSPEIGKQMSNNIYNSLITAYPEHAQIFTENKEKLDLQFDTLIEYADDQLADLSNREIITFHDGFSYMAAAFNITIVHAIEEEAGSEASAATLIELINIVQSHDIAAIFTEKNGSTASAMIIATETGAKLYSLDMALSGDSYFDAMYHNIDTLKEALK